MNLKNKLYGELLTVEKDLRKLARRRLEIKKLLNLNDKGSYRKTTNYNQK